MIIRDTRGEAINAKLSKGFIFAVFKYYRNHRGFRRRCARMAARGEIIKVSENEHSIFYRMPPKTGSALAAAPPEVA